MRLLLLAFVAASSLVTTAALALPPAPAPKAPAAKVEPAKPAPVDPKAAAKPTPIVEAQGLRAGALKEATELADQADALVRKPSPAPAPAAEPPAPTPEEYVKASALYVSAAETTLKRSGELSARMVREAPDTATKAQATTALVADLRKGAAYYQEAARAEHGLTARLLRLGPGKNAREIQSSFVRGQDLKRLAASLENRAQQIALGRPPVLPEMITLRK